MHGLDTHWTRVPEGLWSLKSTLVCTVILMYEYEANNIFWGVNQLNRPAGYAHTRYSAQKTMEHVRYPRSASSAGSLTWLRRARLPQTCGMIIQLSSYRSSKPFCVWTIFLSKFHVIRSMEGVNNIEEICQVERVDCVWVSTSTILPRRTRC